MSSKKQQAQATKDTAALSKASSLDLSKALHALSSSGVTIQSTLSKISEELITKHAELQAVDDAIALKKAEMIALHGADQLLLTIDELKEEQIQLVKDMDTDRANLTREHAELADELATVRQREESDYNYRLQHGRKSDMDAWKETIRVRDNQERDRQEKCDKNHTEREETLRAKEDAYSKALSKIDTFDAEVQKASDKAVAIVTNSLKKEYDHKIEMTAVKHEAEVNQSRSENRRLVEALNNLEANLKEVQTQLKDAYAANAALAAKTVEGASNKQAQADALAMLTNIGGNGQARPRG